MYLKTLEIQGFKSFPDKTVIEFDKGMTAIVGANGSGKSNISDAVRWVLGEMSAKSLRGNKMEDVIFNGSSKRKPASFAEVVMTIDNSDSLMKIDYDEVSVGRRLYRSGESEYYLNKKQVRLKDVVDLFLNTGIGREGYSVISQGKIAEVISLKAQERRELFEEAAGISRFRYRKHEAGLKLQSVNENALRIQDILSEVQSRLPRLESQAAKAKEYLSVVEEKKHLEMGIWSQRLEKLDRFSKEGKEAWEREDREIRLLSDEIESQDRTIDALYTETQEKSVQSELLRGEVSALAGTVSDLTANLSVLENEIHHMQMRRDELHSEGEKGSVQKNALEEEKAAIFQNFSKIQEELDQVEGRFSDNRARQDALAGEYATLSEKEETLLGEKDALGEKHAALSLQLKEDEGFGRAGLEQKKELEKRLLEDMGLDEQKLAHLEDLRLAAQKAQQSVQETEKQNGKINLALYELGEKIEEKTQLRQNVRLEKMEAEQRRDTLLRMERLLEGFSDSVKEVMNAAGEELSGICGPVSKLISTGEEYVLAVETALGGGVQNIIVEDEKSAKEAIGFLKKNRLGRATFLPLTTLRAGKYDTSHIQDAGFVGVASDLCRSEAKYEKAVEFLLGKTLVCRDIDTASLLAKKEKYGVRIVTLDGQIIHAGGSFTGGQALHLTGVLSRSGDLARLKEKIDACEEKITAFQKEIDEMEAEREELRGKVKEIEASLSALRLSAGQAQNALTLEEERLSTARSATQQMKEEIAQIEEKLRQKEERGEKIREEMNLLSQREKSLEEELEQIQAKIEEKEKDRESLIVSQGEILALRGQTQLRLEQEAERLNEKEEALRVLTEGGKSKEEALAELAQKEEDALSQIKETEQKREELRGQISEKQSQITSLQQRVTEAGEESARIRGEQKTKLAEKEKKMESFSRLSNRLSAAEKEKDSIVRSLWEEYELQPDSDEMIALRETDTEALGGEKRLQSLRGELRRIGPVSLESIPELEEARERFRFLNTQYSDVAKAKEELEKLISDLESTMRDMFTETFEQIRYTFRQIFVELFGGGSADIELTNREDLLNCGIEIRVQPPGKVIKNLSLLSGGEQAFVAIALYMSLLRINPSPFCIFDEIESALDEANVRRFAEYIKKHNDKTQFIVITHRRGTMEEADTLYGITMQEKGVSDFIRLDVADGQKFASDGK